jgi:hypothetical protein
MDTFDYDKEYKLQQELKSKDQQIKDLTELVGMAEIIIGSIIECDCPSDPWRTFPEKLQSYQQKYLTK